MLETESIKMEMKMEADDDPQHQFNQEPAPPVKQETGEVAPENGKEIKEKEREKDRDRERDKKKKHRSRSRSRERGDRDREKSDKKKRRTKSRSKEREKKVRTRSKSKDRRDRDRSDRDKDRSERGGGRDRSERDKDRSDRGGDRDRERGRVKEESKKAKKVAETENVDPAEVRPKMKYKFWDGNIKNIISKNLLAWN